MYECDRTYHLLRARIETGRARECADQAVARIHLELARLHHDKALRDGPFIITQPRMAQNR